MKKLSVLILVCLMLSLTACQSGVKETTNDSSAQPTQEAATTSQQTIEPNSTAQPVLSDFWPKNVLYGYDKSLFPDFEVGVTKNDEGEIVGTLTNSNGIVITVPYYNQLGGLYNLNISNGTKSVDAEIDLNWGGDNFLTEIQAVALRDIDGDGEDELVFALYSNDGMSSSHNEYYIFDVETLEYYCLNSRSMVKDLEANVDMDFAYELIKDKVLYNELSIIFAENGTARLSIEGVTFDGTIDSDVITFTYYYDQIEDRWVYSGEYVIGETKKLYTYQDGPDYNLENIQSAKEEWERHNETTY